MLKLAFFEHSNHWNFQAYFYKPPFNCEGEGGIPKIEAKKPFLKAILKHILSPSKTNKKEETKANLKPFI
jgi:hypothetical protein